MTINPEVSEAAHRRTDLIAGLHDLDAWLPGPVTHQLTVPPGLDHEQKLAWLEEVAADWETVTSPDGMGGRRTEKRSGALRLVASVSCPDPSVSGYKARVAAFRTAQAGNGARA